MKTAKKEARKFFHGDIMGAKSNLQPIAKLFPTSPTWQLEQWKNCWCAAFVYYCVIKAGYDLPVKYPSEAVSCNFAGVKAWEEWAKLSENQYWLSSKSPSFTLEPGDIVLFDHVFLNQEHDHIGIVVEVKRNTIKTAEGNFNNVSAIVERPIEEHNRGVVRLPEIAKEKG
jgi:hypothetical protein